MTNFQIQQAWLLNEITADSIKHDLQEIKQCLISNEQLISKSIGISPLEFSELLALKLEKIKNSKNKTTDLDADITTCEGNLAIYQSFLRKNIRSAIKVADDMEQMHQASISAWKNYFNNLLESNDYRSIFTPNNTAFQNGLICYYNVLQQLNFESLEKYKTCIHSHSNNMLAQLFLNDQDFLKALESGQFTSGGEISHLMMQRFLLIDPRTRGRKKILMALIPGGCFHDFFEKEFFKYNPEVFKSEIIKLALYKSLSLQHGNKQPVAWIGSAKTLTTLLINPERIEQEINGIYLNCDDNKWTAELNRAWLFALVHMGYEIKLVEQQFPNVKEALFSSTPSTNFLVALLMEIRQMDEENTSEHHSQYHGGDSPTATSLEILLLLSLGCEARRNVTEGNISLHTPTSLGYQTTDSPAISRINPFNVTPTKILPHTHSASNTPVSTHCGGGTSKRNTCNIINAPKESSSSIRQQSVSTYTTTTYTPNTLTFTPLTAPPPGEQNMTLSSSLSDPQPVRKLNF